MALYIFVKSILEINLLKFLIMEIILEILHIDDIVEGIILAINKVPKINKNWGLKKITRHQVKPLTKF